MLVVDANGSERVLTERREVVFTGRRGVGGASETPPRLLSPLLCNYLISTVLSTVAHSRLGHIFKVPCIYFLLMYALRQLSRGEKENILL